MARAIAGKDSTTGHWEMAGLELDRAFPDVSERIPVTLLDRLSEQSTAAGSATSPRHGTESSSVSARSTNEPASSSCTLPADSVFQIAAHEVTVPLDELYGICRAARALLSGDHAGRSRDRADRSSGVRETIAAPRIVETFVVAAAPTLLDRLTAGRASVITVGKVDDLFAGAA
jgi:phosphopentomutase